MPLLFLTLLVIAIYWPTLSFPFVNYDDPVNIAGNPFFNPLTLGNVARLWTETHLDLYIPLTYSVWAMLAWFGYRGTRPVTAQGDASLILNPSLFHLANLVFFLASVFLVFQVLRRLLKVLAPTTGDAAAFIWPAFAGAALFAVHPLQVESVAWVTSLKGTLSGFFFLASFFGYLRFKEPNQTVMARNLWHSASLLLFIAAALSKPSAIVLPLFLATVGHFIFKMAPRRLLKELSPWLVISLFFSALTSYFYRSSTPLTTNPFGRIVVALDTFTAYVTKVFYPHPLLIEYGRLPAEVLANPFTILTTIFAVTVIVLVARTYKKNSSALAPTALLFFIAPLVPVLGFKEHEMQHVTNICDRYALLSMIGPALAFSFLLQSPNFKRPLKLLSVMLIFLCVVVSIRQVSVWKNDFTLYAHTLKYNPSSERAYKNLAAAYEEANDYDSAAIFYQKAAELRPRAEVFNSLGAMQLHRKQLAAAGDAFRRAMELEPNDSRFTYNFAVSLAMLGRTEEAKSFYTSANRLAEAQGLPPFPRPKWIK